MRRKYVYSMSNEDDPATKKGQLLEVYDVQGSAGKARLTVDGGCIAFDEDRMVEILKNCDMSLVITIKE